MTSNMFHWNVLKVTVPFLLTAVICSRQNFASTYRRELETCGPRNAGIWPSFRKRPAGSWGMHKLWNNVLLILQCSLQRRKGRPFFFLGSFLYYTWNNNLHPRPLNCCQSRPCPYDNCSHVWVYAGRCFNTSLVCATSCLASVLKWKPCLTKRTDLIPYRSLTRVFDPKMLHFLESEWKSSQ